MGSDRPENAAAAAIGRPREVDLREVVQAIYILSTGCQWRALPREFPPYSTVQSYFYAWRDTGRWHRIVKALVRQARRKLGRRPTAAIIDSQSAATTQAGGPAGFDPGKRIYGRKRHIVTDTNGLLLAVHVHPANVQDVHGAVPLLKRLRERFPKLKQVFADRVYRGQQLVNALSECGPHRDRRTTARRQRLPTAAAAVGRRTDLCMVRPLSPPRKRFRSIPATEVAWLLIAHLRLLTRRLAKP